jgi:hypothetical protein
MAAGGLPPVPSVLPSLYASLILQSTRFLDVLQKAGRAAHMSAADAGLSQNQVLAWVQCVGSKWLQDEDGALLICADVLRSFDVACTCCMKHSVDRVGHLRLLRLCCAGSRPCLCCWYLPLGCRGLGEAALLLPWTWCCFALA